MSYLGETNVGGLLTEALTADVQAVLADETSGVGADAAVGRSSSQPSIPFHSPSISNAYLQPSFYAKASSIIGFIGVKTHHSREPLP